MKANVTTAQVQPGKVEEAVRIYRDVVFPDIQQQQGFKAAFLLTDPTTGVTQGIKWPWRSLYAFFGEFLVGFHPRKSVPDLL
jgi:hypothetical protein